LKKVLLTQAIRPVGMELLAQEVEVVVAPDRKEETILRMVDGFDALINRTTSIGKEIIEKGKHLKAVASHGVGFNLIDVETATKNGVCVINAPGANSQAVAEFVVAMMLALTRKLITADSVQRVERRFDKRDQLTGYDLHNKTVSIIGLGQIGRKVAKICGGGFDMKVIGYDPFVSQADMAALGITKSDDIDALFREADFVSINCPYTKEVEGMVNKEKFAPLSGKLRPRGNR
jgi:Phosphoglycerate dehydrogenase and related dehydrogenases